MLKKYKRREIDPYERVEVYRNVNKKGVWYSVRQGGKVVAHVTEISLRDCVFIVQEKGRERVKKTGRKNVHAWVEGWLTNYAKARIGKVMEPISYNPYRSKYFRTKKAKRVTKAESVVLYSGGVLAHIQTGAKRVR